MLCAIARFYIAFIYGASPVVLDPPSPKVMVGNDPISPIVGGAGGFNPITHKPTVILGTNGF